MRRRFLIQIALAATAIGFADAVYLTVKHYAGTPLICTLTDGCDLVLSSAYSSVVGIPIALVGVGYYGLLLALLVGFLYTKDKVILLAALIIAAVGFLISLGLIYLQIWVILAICGYCLVSAVSTSLLLVSLWISWYQW